MNRIPTVTFWAGNWGDFRLPDDFPTSVLRNNGWFDKRFGVYPKIREYIEEHDSKIRDGLERPGFTAMPFITWMHCGLVPNRLYGTTINQEGDAI